MRKVKEIEIPKELEELLSSISDEVTTIIAKRLKRIGKLKPEQVESTFALLQYFNEDIDTITNVLSKKSKLTDKQVEKMLIDSAKECQGDVAEFYTIANKTQIPYELNKPLQAIVKAAKSKMMDFSSTTGNIGIVADGRVVSIREGYTKAINKGVLAVKTGALDYNTAIKSTIKDLGKGVRAVYPSGRSMRIDSAVRMNVLDGTRQMNREIRREEGKAFGSNGVYIMPHGLCATDHLPYQGKEYTYAQIDKINGSLERPIGTGDMNCKHVLIDIIVGEGVHPYTKEELKKIDKYSTEKVMWNDKEMTRYEASQEQRKTETEIRGLKDRLTVANAEGNTLESVRLKNSIREKTALYKANSKKADLRPKSARL